ncbi:MAG TPA: DinB family protein [Bacteroidia bacterium]|nr:DinB family protein [Bacteroidia bacterium]HNU32546.1 DinB family protein [Bacteroidia bacterium]
MIYRSVINTLSELTDLLNQLNTQEYTNHVNHLSNATIGQHTRHIIELFQCLINNYETGTVNYDSRLRNRKIETDIKYAVACIESIMQSINKVDIEMLLEQNLEGQTKQIKTSYLRELFYNLEHCIHHQALIKVALFDNSKILVSKNFGVAPSTIQYRNACVQ